MKNKQTKGLKAIVVSLFLASAVLAGCKDDNQDYKEPAPTISLDNSLFVKVTDSKDLAITGSAVKLEGEGFTAEGVTDASGKVAFNGLSKSGSYTVTAKKVGFISSASLEIVTIPAANGFKGTKNLILAEVVTPTSISTTGGTIAAMETAPEMGSIAYDFTVAAGALTEAKQISITPMSTSSYAVAPSANSMSVLAFNCQPDGTTFTTPAVLKIVPFGSYVIDNPSLLLFSNGAWVNQPGAITVNGSAYDVNISHFSDYQIALNFSSITKTKNVESALVKRVDNIDGKKGQTIENVDVTSKSGYEFITSPAAALNAAGITGADATAISNTIHKMVNSYLGIAKAGFVTTSFSAPINTTVPVGYAVNINSATEYETISFTLPLKKNGTTTNVTIKVKIVSSLSINAVAQSSQHHGGGTGL